MDRLSRLDAGFLEAEDSDRHVSLAIGALSVIAGPMPSYESLIAGLTERILSVSRFRQVLRGHPMDLAAPDWVDDPEFDISHHLRHSALPSPGDDADLFRFAAETMEQRLDRERPLWECWIIEGLAEGRWAILMKIHHCIADGIATMHMLSGLSDGGVEDTFANRIHASRQVSERRRSTSRLSLNPLSWLGATWRAAGTATGAATLAAEGAVEITSGLLRQASPSPLVGPLTGLRRYSAVRVPLADTEKVCSVHGVTVNDVALAAITNSFREGLIRRGITPRRNSLPTLVPVSMRSGQALNATDNRVSMLLPYLPVEKTGPVEQLRTVHNRLSRAKRSGQREASSIFVAAMNVVPFPLTAWAVRALTRLPQRGVVTLATNVPGPRRRMRIMGREVLCVYPIPPIAVQLRTVIAILSYADDLVFGITADYDAAPDVDELTQGIADTVMRLAVEDTRAGR
ncbi:diacylglycerol O-acyltransferase [Mycobacterium frederiksbergense]|uniref:Diacylglycerol O-acyltransferase n=1 Tax=Mycolicibacterium frederiksbergense TaxID=117567 RepID=A0ABT6KVY2_9MYCO|nr:wax ester/triacylglycerol synthase family O-acyltransferase [Mycolicibacterium frederiksbergense]MDH6194015.1 diacylglycerol O-acyltransferase [Mycolicibacterium frederiksbergense]